MVGIKYSVSLGLRGLDCATSSGIDPHLCSVPPFSPRLLSGNKGCSVENLEECKENSEEKDYCLDSKKEVGVLTVF